MEDHLRAGRDEDVILCRLDEIPDGTGRGFTVETNLGMRDIMVIRQGGRVFGYENACPHVGTPLDWLPDQFLSEDGSHIVCATHGAKFRIADGMCFSGPCHGVPLNPAVIVVRDGEVVLEG